MLAFCRPLPGDRPSRPYSILLSILVALSSHTSCTTVAPVASPAPLPRPSTLERLSPILEPEIHQATSGHRPDFAAPRQGAETVPARFKRSMAVESLQHPWKGLTGFERHGLLLAQLAEGGAPNLPALLNALEAGMDRPSALRTSPPLPPPATPESAIATLVHTLTLAASHRDRALKLLTLEDRDFLFQHTATWAGHFTPQYSSLSGQTMAQLTSNMRFASLLTEHVDYTGLIASAQVLAQLADAQWLDAITEAFRTAPPLQTVPPGITGEIVLAKDTAYGLVVIGGTGSNTYEMDGRFAVIIDLGGDDLYRGLIGSSSSAERGNAVVIDLDGHDTYIGERLGLATGRLGVGLVIDRAGNDRYHMSEGSGGAGFAGLGILLDVAGDDTYTGSRLTQGAAIGGLGLLWDLNGHDRYSSHAYAIGFGGPLGIGAVIDVAGDDQYDCGSYYPSVYNAEDAPAGKPGDPLYQYECFGLGAGSGSRVLSKRPEWQHYSLAGGSGLLIDIGGHDAYHSANFSQGLGYFFGLGMKLDLNGNDRHEAARYGHGAAAHYGTALFLDRQGNDQYSSTGPFYNAGAAWDHSVSMAVDAGTGQDRYAFQRSTGLGRADYSSWGIFVDEGGADHYHTQSGFGTSSEFSFAGFFDLEGDDAYTLSAEAATGNGPQPGNARRIDYPNGGLFLDR